MTLIDSVGLNPHVRGGYSGQVQVQVLEGAMARIVGGLFTDAGSKTVVFAVDGTLSIAKTQTVYAANARLSVGNTDDGIAFGAVRTVTSVGEFSHRYVPPPADPPPAVVKIADGSPPAFTTHVATFDSSFTGGAGQDRIKIDTDAKTGLTKIAAFGADDLVLLSKALRDSNNDNIVGVGSKGRFNDADGDSLVIAGVKSLRYLGIVDGAHAYADLADRPKGAIEGTSANTVFKGDAGGMQAETFFFDTALDIGLGRDRISSFAASDRIVVSEKLIGGADGVVHAGSDGFALNADVAGSTDSLSIADLSGQSVSSLALVGQHTAAGIVFYTYAAVAGDYLI